MWTRKKCRSPLAGALSSLLAGVALALAAHAAEDTNSVASQLPDMGSPENAILSKTDEFQIGLMAMHQLRGQGLILEDPELSDYIQNLGSRLASQARDDDQNFQYFILRSTEINAFATYGGFICINSGLILLTDTESDLAAVMGHETAHVRQRHIARSILAQSRMSLGTTAAMLAAVLIGAASGAGGAGDGRRDRDEPGGVPAAEHEFQPRRRGRSRSHWYWPGGGSRLRCLGDGQFLRNHVAPSG